MDKDFFTQKTQECAGMMYRIAYTLLRSDQDCQDAVQTALLKAWEKRESLRDKAWFQTWIVRILMNTCYDMRKARRNTVSIDEAPEPSVPPPDPALAMALQSLPDKLRLPLVLCCSEGMTYAQAAAALHVPQATVRGRIHRAKALLRKELEEQ